MLLDGTPAAADIVNIIEWAQHCFVKVLSIILDGPKVAVETAVDAIGWVQHYFVELLSIILNGPKDTAETCC
jgi:hypothetical protein